MMKRPSNDCIHGEKIHGQLQKQNKNPKLMGLRFIHYHLTYQQGWIKEINFQEKIIIIHK
uniref:Cyclin-P3-1 isoform X1 n=1 Tax=Rhizophora mucronata TaxID=61149 RepID=A0A2P2L794_RHIMU